LIRLKSKAVRVNKKLSMESNENMDRSSEAPRMSINIAQAYVEEVEGNKPRFVLWMIKMLKMDMTHSKLMFSSDAVSHLVYLRAYVFYCASMIIFNSVFSVFA